MKMKRQMLQTKMPNFLHVINLLNLEILPAKLNTVKHRLSLIISDLLWDTAVVLDRKNLLK